LVSISIDKDVNMKCEVISQLLRYFDNDTICYHEPYPDSLVELQKKYWLPILDWAQNTYNIEIKTTDGISGLKQSENTKEKLKNVIENFDSLKLSGMIVFKKLFYVYIYFLFKLYLL
jgi:ATP synthase F1 complex assembly factor 2